MSASLSADLHELIRTTALVLRRGLLAATLGAAIVAALGGAVFEVSMTASHQYSQDDFVLGVGCALVGWFAALLAPSLAWGVVLAAFTHALAGPARLGRALVGGFAHWPLLTGLLVLGLAPGGCLAAGYELIGSAFQEPLLRLRLLVLGGVGLLLLGAWMLGAVILVPAAEVVAGERFHELRWQPLALVAGVVPVLLTGALLGRALIPVVPISPALSLGILGLAHLGIVTLTLALSVAAHAVSQRRPEGGPP